MLIKVTQYRWNEQTMVPEDQGFVEAATVRQAAEQWAHAYWDRPLDTFSQTSQAGKLTVKFPDCERFDWLQFEAAETETAATEPETRYAVVAGPCETVARYLPDNYRVVDAFADMADRRLTLIAGEDSHGWTLDGYVIPRLLLGRLMAANPELFDGELAARAVAAAIAAVAE